MSFCRWFSTNWILVVSIVSRFFLASNLDGLFTDRWMACIVIFRCIVSWRNIFFQISICHMLNNWLSKFKSSMRILCVVCLSSRHKGHRIWWVHLTVPPIFLDRFVIVQLFAIYITLSFTQSYFNSIPICFYVIVLWTFVFLIRIYVAHA